MTSKEKEREFIGLIEQHSRLIYKVCYMFASCPEELNDLYQEILINLWRSHDAYRREAKYSTWIYRIGLNTCVSHVRGKNRKPPTIPLSVDLEQISEQEDHSEQLKELYRLINLLSKIEKAIILLYLEENTYEEIGKIIGITRGNVAVKINRIKKKLKILSNQ